MTLDDQTVSQASEARDHAMSQKLSSPRDLTLRRYYASRFAAQLTMLWGDEDSARILNAAGEEIAKLERYRIRVCREAFAWADAMIAAESEGDA